jgi:FtsZ-binding cell division protein ZapB
LEELIKLEERITKMISTISALKQRVQELEQDSERSKTREAEAKKRVDGLIEKVDNLLI